MTPDELQLATRLVEHPDFNPRGLFTWEVHDNGVHRIGHSFQSSLYTRRQHSTSPLPTHVHNSYLKLDTPLVAGVLLHLLEQDGFTVSVRTPIPTDPRKNHYWVSAWKALPTELLYYKGQGASLGVAAATAWLEKHETNILE